MSKRALLLIDIQNDFMPGGSLAVADGFEVVPVANDLVARFQHVFATQDWHPENHGSFADNNDAEIGSIGELDGLPQVMWPRHCVQNTPGAAFVADLELEDAVVVQKGTNPNVDSYSGFFDNGQRQQTQLDELLKREEIDTLYIAGVATDYCVAYTALDARRLGYDTYVVIDGCRGVDLNPGDVDRAIGEMRDAGIKIIKSEEVT